MHNFSTEEKLKDHNITYPKCVNEPTKTTYPSKEEAFIEFKNFNNQFKAPFVIYADFECNLQKYDDENKTDKMNKTQLHKANSCCYYIVSGGALNAGGVSTINNNFDLLLFRSDVSTSDFINSLLVDKDKILKTLHNNISMVLTDKDETNFNISTDCHICHKPLYDDKVKDHCHQTGKYLGASHNKCNLDRNFKNYKIPVFIHNCKGYDSHLIISELTQFVDIKEIKVIPKSEEKYISFEFKNLKFVDSYSFLGASLDELVKNLRNDNNYDMSRFNNTLKYFKQQYPHLNNEQLKLVLKKGEFPYEYIDCSENFNDSQLPDEKWFNSSLSPLDMNKYDHRLKLKQKYNHAKNVWDTFKIKNLGEYNDLYLKLDVLLLADVFENFRDICLHNYQLDPAYYLTAPSLSMDALLKMYGKK